MNVMDTLLRRKRVTKTTVVEVEETFDELDELKDEETKQIIRETLDDLNHRVAMLESELQLYGRG